MQLGRVLELELVVLGRRDLGEQPIGPSTLDRGVWNGDESTAPPVQLTLQNTAVTDNSLVASRGLTEVGRLIVKAAAGNLKKVTLELGGKSPQVLYKDADMDVAIPGAANGIFLTRGKGGVVRE